MELLELRNNYEIDDEVPIEESRYFKLLEINEDEVGSGVNLEISFPMP